MKILNLKIFSPSGEKLRDIKFNKDGLSIIYGDISMPEDKSKTSNSLGKSLLLKFIDYIFGADEDSNVIPKVLHDYRIEALVIYKNIEYNITRILGKPKEILVCNERYTLDKYKIFFNIDRTLFRNQIILSSRKNSINSHGKKPNRLEMLAFLKLIKVNDSIIENTNLIYLSQDEIKDLKTSKKNNIKFLKGIDEKKVDQQIFYLEKDIEELEKEIKNISTQIENIQITNLKKEIIEKYNKKNEEFKKFERDLFLNELEIKRMETFLKEYNNIDITSKNVFKLYEKAKIEIPDLVKKELKEVEEFHKNVYLDRKKTLSKRINDLKIDNEKKKVSLEENKKELDKLGKIISENKIYKESIEIFKNYTSKLDEKKYQQGELSSIYKINKEIENKNNQLDLYFKDLGSSFNKEEKHIQELRDFLYRFVNTLYKDKNSKENINTYLKLSSKKKHERTRPIDLEITIPSDRGEGINQVKNNLIDILLMKFNEKLYFLIQDSSCYSGIDSRQVSKTLKELDKIAADEKKQAIVSINKFQLSDDEETHELIQKKKVINLSENEKLLKRDF